MKLVGERRALASIVFAFYFLMYLLNAILGPPEVARLFFGIAGVYFLAFFSLVAGYFWARWYSVGVGLYGEYPPFPAGAHGRGEAEQAQVGADVPHRVPGTHRLGREPEQQRVHAGHRAGEVPQSALRGHVDPCAVKGRRQPPADNEAMGRLLNPQPQVHAASRI